MLSSEKANEEPIDFPMRTLLSLLAASTLCFVLSTSAATTGKSPTADKPVTADKPAAAAAYCGSSKSNVYHRPGCSAAKQIKAENLVSFATKEEAAKRAYRPCKICKP